MLFFLFFNKKIIICCCCSFFFLGWTDDYYRIEDIGLSTQLLPSLLLFLISTNCHNTNDEM